MRSRAHAFTLIELSIVIVVLALLVGTVLAGRQMVKNQELRKVLSDATSFDIAFDQFQTKYGAVPGDMANATEIWGRADGVAGTGQCAAPDTTASVGKPTCNGSGYGFIYWAGTATLHDRFRAWQQMAAADLIAGKYTGIYNGSETPGANTPKGALTGSGYGWMPNTMPTLIDANSSLTNRNRWYDGNYTNALMFGAVGGFGYGSPMLLPEEMASMDTKSDDGAPATGYIRSWKPTYVLTPNCAVGGTSSATYNLSYTSAACSILFMTSKRAESK